jgi:hypothetical protein
MPRLPIIFAAVGLGLMLNEANPIFAGQPNPPIAGENSPVATPPPVAESFEVQAYTRDGYLIPANFIIFYDGADLQRLTSRQERINLSNNTFESLQELWDQVTGSLEAHDINDPQRTDGDSTPAVEQLIRDNAFRMAETIKEKCGVRIGFDDDFKVYPPAPFGPI